jgi:hypothetical protein
MDDRTGKAQAPFEAETPGTSGQCTGNAEASDSGESVAVDDGNASDTGVIYFSSGDEEDV